MIRDYITCDLVYEQEQAGVLLGLFNITFCTLEESIIFFILAAYFVIPEYCMWFG